MPRYVAVRGTSQLEGYHHHLADLLTGANYSAYLAGALITYFNFRWAAGGGRRAAGGGRRAAGGGRRAAAASMAAAAARRLWEGRHRGSDPALPPPPPPLPPPLSCT
jgi:hypothetical protein